MTTNEKISFLYGQLHKSINTMDMIVDGLMQRHEADFISAYRVLTSLTNGYRVICCVFSKSCCLSRNLSLNSNLRLSLTTE